MTRLNRLAEAQDNYVEHSLSVTLLGGFHPSHFCDFLLAVLVGLYIIQGAEVN